MMRAITTLLLVAAALLVSTSARAHKPSDSYLTLTVTGATLEGRWDIALRDLDYTIGLDENGDGAVTWGELRARSSAIDAYASARLTVKADGSPCARAAGDHLVVEHSDGAYVVLRFELSCGGTRALGSIDVDYQLFFEVDPQHRGLLRIEGAGETRALTFAADRRSQHVDVRAPARSAQLAAIVAVGVHHIWEGYDHLLFLLALLLPAVLQRDGSSWRPVARFRPALWDVVRIVTAFTVAHSITLSLAALDVLRLPSRLTESAIAASVIVVALNNLVPVMREDRWLAAFALGLLHGFGFSATLIDLGLPRSSLLPTLFGFNLGVEIGQMTVVLAFLPLAFVLRKTLSYRRFALVGGSIAIAALASIWFVERAFAIRIIG